MIAKKYRLKEREVKKVLGKGKPFFSYNIVFNVIPNRLGYSRFGIVISGKVCPNNVIRNIFRRSFYDMCKNYQEKNYGDIVCLVKSKSRFGGDDTQKSAFNKEITYLFEKKLGKNT